MVRGRNGDVPAWGAHELITTSRYHVHKCPGKQS